MLNSTSILMYGSNIELLQLRSICHCACKIGRT